MFDNGERVGKMSGNNTLQTRDLIETVTLSIRRKKYE